MKYLVTVQQMATDPKEGMDFVATWSGVVAEQDLGRVELELVGDILNMAMVDSPASLRPMTADEIKDWRKDHSERVWLDHGAIG